MKCRRKSSAKCQASVSLLSHDTYLPLTLILYHVYHDHDSFHEICRSSAPGWQKRAKTGKWKAFAGPAGLTTICENYIGSYCPAFEIFLRVLSPAWSSKFSRTLSWWCLSPLWRCDYCDKAFIVPMQCNQANTSVTHSANRLCEQHYWNHGEWFS